MVRRNQVSFALEDEKGLFELPCAQFLGMIWKGLVFHHHQKDDIWHVLRSRHLQDGEEAQRTRKSVLTSAIVDITADIPTGMTRGVLLVKIILLNDIYNDYMNFPSGSSTFGRIYCRITLPGWLNQETATVGSFQRCISTSSRCLHFQIYYYISRRRPYWYWQATNVLGGERETITGRPSCQYGWLRSRDDKSYVNHVYHGSLIADHFSC